MEERVKKCLTILGTRTPKSFVVNSFRSPFSFSRQNLFPWRVNSSGINVTEDWYCGEWVNLFIPGFSLSVCTIISLINNQKWEQITNNLSLLTVWCFPYELSIVPHTEN